MAFCKYCGKQLQEGEICSCQTAAQPAPTTASAPLPPPIPAPAASAPLPPPIPAPAPSATTPPPVPSSVQPAPNPGTTTVTVTLPNKDAVSAAAKSVFSSILDVLLHPATGSCSFVQNANKLVALMIMGIHALFSCIFSLVIVGKINSTIGKAVYYSNIKFSMPKAFFVTLLFVIIFTIIFTALLFVITILAGMKPTVGQVLALSAIRSIVSLVLCIPSIVLGLFNPGIGLCVFWGSILLTALFLVGALKGLSNASDNKAVYVALAATVLFTFLFCLIGSKLALGMYIPDNLNVLNLINVLNSML